MLLDGGQQPATGGAYTMTNKQVVSVVGAMFLALPLDGCATRSPRVSDTSRVPAAQAPEQPVAAQAPAQSHSQSQPQPQAAASRVAMLWKERAGAAESAFCLGPGDLLEVSVPRVDEMQGLRARISPTGTITLPHVGAIQAAGLTEAELRDRLKQRLGQTLLRDPQVSLFVAEHESP